MILRAQWSGTSDHHKYLADNVVAKASSQSINGTNLNGTHLNGAAFDLYFRNMRILDALDDEYGGVLVSPDGLPDDPSAFAPVLGLSLSHWKKMVYPLTQSHMFPIMYTHVVKEVDILLRNTCI